jgi:hypothetical protein
MRGKELRMDQVLRSDASSGQRVREQKLESLVRATSYRESIVHESGVRKEYQEGTIRAKVEGAHEA